MHRHMMSDWKQGNHIAPPELDHKRFMVVSVPVMAASVLVVMVVFIYCAPVQKAINISLIR
jgi:hypothetical protein